jgi:hypothetical protein
MGKSTINDKYNPNSGKKKHQTKNTTVENTRVHGGFAIFRNSKAKTAENREAS